MKLIALETSAKTASAAVVTEGKLLGVSSVTAGLTHSQTILPLLETLLKGVSMELSDADGFAVSIGPGSFTGLRIGISAVKGMAQGLGKGCVGISTLEGLAWNFQGLHYTVCPVMDARCGQVYTSLFWVNGGRPQRLWEDMAIPLDTLKEKLQSVEGDVMLVGDGAELAFTALASTGKVLLPPPALRYQSAASVGFAALARRPCCPPTCGCPRPSGSCWPGRRRKRLPNEKISPKGGRINGNGGIIMLALASDHGGFALKQAVIEHLNERGIPFKDFGCYEEKSCDYPDVAAPACDAVVSGECEKALLFCGTGVGISIAANKINGIRACVCSDYFSAKYTRAHNDANALCLGGRVVGPGLAIELVDIFLDTPYEGGRHQRRVDKLTALEERERAGK